MAEDEHHHRRLPLSHYVSSFFNNWRESDLPFAEKLPIALRNRAIASRKGCCGHHGQPGC